MNVHLTFQNTYREIKKMCQELPAPAAKFIAFISFHP